MELPYVPYLLTVVPAFLASVIKTKSFPIKQLVASALLLLVLAGLESWNSQLTNSFAWLLAISSLIYNGPALFNTVTKAV